MGFVGQGQGVVTGTTRDDVIGRQVFRTQREMVVASTQVGLQEMLSADGNRIVAVAGIDDGLAVGRAVVGIAGGVTRTIDGQGVVATAEREVVRAIAVDRQGVIPVAHVDGVATIAVDFERHRYRRRPCH